MAAPSSLKEEPLAPSGFYGKLGGRAGPGRGHTSTPTIPEHDSDDDWEVEAVVEYRCVYGTEQWLVKWKGYGEERNTWEPEANLLTAEVQAEAAKVREAGLPRTAAGLQKAVVVTLKAVLAARGLDTSGQKAQLVARLLSVLQGE